MQFQSMIREMREVSPSLSPLKLNPVNENRESEKPIKVTQQHEMSWQYAQEMNEKQKVALEKKADAGVGRKI